MSGLKIDTRIPESKKGNLNEIRSNYSKVLSCLKFPFRPDAGYLFKISENFKIYAGNNTEGLILY